VSNAKEIALVKMRRVNEKVYNKKDKLLREKLNRTSNDTCSVPLISYPVKGALPEALDDSEEGTSLVLVGVSAEDEGLASAEELASSNLALGALDSKSNLLGLLGLLSEDGLGLTTETGLLVPISASTLRLLRVLALLVLSNLEFHVLLAVLAISVLSLRSMHLEHNSKRG